MKKKTIAIIGPGLEHKGGISTVTKAIYNSEIQDYYDIVVIDTYGKHKVLKFVKALILYIFILKNIDIVHINLSYKGSFVRKLFFTIITPMNKKILIHSHGSFFIEFYKNQSRFIKRLIKYTFSKADVIISVSNVYMELLCKEIGVSKNKIKTIYNGINLPEINKEKELSSKEIKVLFMGKLIKKRGIYDFIEIAKKMQFTCDVKFVIVGDGNKDEILTKIREYKLNNVEVIGWVNGEQKEKILKESHIFINPWIYESFGISMVEAMSHGQAIIGYNGGSIPEIVNDNVNGYIVNQGDIDGVVNYIKYLINDRDKLNKISIENINYAKKFSNEMFIHNFLNTYRNL